MAKPEPDLALFASMASGNDHRNLRPGPEYYRAQAEYCRQRADKAEHEPGIRQKYLDLTERWEDLARAAETS